MVPFFGGHPVYILTRKKTRSSTIGYLRNSDVSERADPTANDALINDHIYTDSIS